MATRFLCDFCDCEIKGPRYRCAHCPDFDLCESCTQEQGVGGPLWAHDRSHTFYWITSDSPLRDQRVHVLADTTCASSPPRSPPHTSTRTDPAAVHRHHAICDNCDFPIMGVRFKCVNCPDYDLCAYCESLMAQRRQPIHHPSHIFLKVIAPLPSPLRPDSFYQQPILYSSPVLWSERRLHRGYICRSCVTPLVGTRFACANCSYDICESCEASGCHQHDPTHVFAKLTFPVTESSCERERELNVSRPIVLPILYGAPAQVQPPPAATAVSPVSLRKSPRPALEPLPVVLRAMERSDLGPVLHIEALSFATPFKAGFFTNLIDSSRGVAAVADVACRSCVAYICYTFHDPCSGTLHVMNLAVDPAFRGRKIAETCLHHALHDGMAHGCTRVDLCVSVYNTAALGLYKKMGFRPVRWLDDYYAADHTRDLDLELADALLLRLALPSAAHDHDHLSCT